MHKDVVAVVPYYNFFGSAWISENHAKAIQKLNESGVFCYTAEVSLDGVSKVEESDYHRAIHRKTGSVLWHKEALINMAARWLRANTKYKYVAWVDSGTFLSGNWADDFATKAGAGKFVQLYNKFVYVNKAGTGLVKSEYGAVCGRRRGRFRGTNPGGAWGCSLSFFSRNMLYPYCVAGGGDRVVYNALIRRPQPYSVYSNATLWAANVAHAVDYVDVPLVHLWHCSRDVKYHQDRHLALAALKYNPRTDVHLVNGILEWRTAKAPLVKFVGDYLSGRSDGSGVPYMGEVVGG